MESWSDLIPHQGLTELPPLDNAYARNERSLRAMGALGMRREALLRSHRVDRDGVRCDEVVYGILREEWQE